MKTYYWIALLALAGVVLGQPPVVWNYPYGLDQDPAYAYGMVETSDGSIIMVGTMWDQVSHEDYQYFRKLNAEGIETSFRVLDYAPNFLYLWINDIIFASDHTLILACSGFASDITGGCLIKMNAEGDTLWLCVIGDSALVEVSSIIEADNGDFVVAGIARYPLTQRPMELMLARVTSQGGVLWRRYYPGRTGAWWNPYPTIVKSHRRGYAICSQAHSDSIDSEHGQILEVDDNGLNPVFYDIERPVGAQTYFWSMAATADSGYVLAGRIDDPIDHPYLVKLNVNFEIAWTRRYGLTEWGPNELYEVEALPNGDIIVGSESDIPYQPPGLWRYSTYVARLNPQGDTLWTLLIGQDASQDYLTGPICLMADGGYIVTSQVGVLPSRVFLTRLAPDLEATDPEHSRSLVRGFELAQNYPNPFNSTTTLSFSLPHTSPVSLTVFNLLGQTVYEEHLGRLTAGEHRQVFDASELPSGVYVVRVQAGEQSQMRKMVLLR